MFPATELSGVGLYFGTPEAPSLTTVPIRSASFSVTSIRRELDGAEANDVRLPACDAYFLMLYLEDADHADIRADGSCEPVRHYERGSICLVDLDEGAAIRLHSRLNSLAFVLPKALFEEAASLSSGVEARRLACRRGRPDSVLGNLGTALLALLGGGRETSPPALLRHVAVAICAHLLHRYGEAPDSAPPSSGRDAIILDGKRDDDPPLSAIVMGHDLPLDIAARRCGFDDPDRFNAAFATGAGITPAGWPRRLLN